ncbi:GumC family protein [Veillonella parvula]|uniref:GumC family protein n=3 Tax=Veillonella TaxID=29465 RepID=UPI00290EE5B1|nr:GNVR domain-containing protein [Veillonella parvula]MDU5558866.1 GNVR domain-containing protein [Veillonella parvula]
MKGINMGPQVVSYQVIKEILQEYKKFLLCLMGGILIIFLLLALLLPKKYTSSVMIQVKPQNGSLSTLANNSALLSLAGISAGDSVLDYMSLLRSSRVIDPVIKKLDNADSEDEKFDADDFVKKYMQIDNPRGTSILSFTITADSPENAQRIAQDVVDSLQDTIAGVGSTQDSTLVKILGKKNEDAKHKMDADVAALEKYKQENGVFIPNEQEKMLLEQAAGYEKAKSDETVKLNTNTAILSSIEAQIDTQNKNLIDSQMADNPEIQSIRKELFNANEQLAKLQFKFTDDYPEVVKVKENISYLEKQLAKTVAQSISSENVTLSPVQMDLLQKRVVAKNNVESANAALTKLEELSKQNLEKSNQFSQKSVKFLELQRNAKVSTDTYNLLTKSLEELKIKENLDAMDIRVLNSPTYPVKHSWPRKLYVMIVGGLLYLIIAGGFIYFQYTRRMSVMKE